MPPSARPLIVIAGVGNGSGTHTVYSCRNRCFGGGWSHGVWEQASPNAYESVREEGVILVRLGRKALGGHSVGHCKGRLSCPLYASLTRKAVILRYSYLVWEGRWAECCASSHRYRWHHGVCGFTLTSAPSNKPIPLPPLHKYLANRASFTPQPSSVLMCIISSSLSRLFANQ